MTALAWLVAAALLQAPADDAQAPATTSLEGRPPAAEASPLQALVDRARPGDRLVVPAGTYAGDLLIDKPLTLVGAGRPRLVGSGAGSVVRVRAPDVTLEGLDIDGQRGGDLGRDTSGIHVAAPRATIRDCRIVDAIFGIYLREADDATVEHSRVTGIPGRPPGEIGSGIHVWNSQRFVLTGNTIAGTRDGMYIQSSSYGTVRGNVARDLRYGLHYMFSDDNLFEDNSFENGAAGAALMYSKRLTFRRNRFVGNRGFASVGLLLKACDDVLAEHNLIADNARGVFLEGSYRNTLRGNVVAMSDQALVIYDSSHDNRIEGNLFIGNLTPLSLSGRRTDTRIEGNYWADNREPDLDGDGVSDRPYRLSSVFDHLRGNLTAADLYAQGLAAAALGAAEEAFPVLDPVPVLDEHPLARPPALPDVPEPRSAHGGWDPAAAGLPLALLAAGVAILAGGARSWSGATGTP
jgi:nitrous oxidase accessory protein